MATATASAQVNIQTGTPLVASEVVTFLGIGSQGDPSARRLLTHPNSLLAPIVYDSNPPRDTNLDNDILVAPIVTTVLTLSDTKVTRFERLAKDMIVEEQWPGNRRSPSMTAAFMRMLYEYWINPPSATGNVGEFITWQPRDRTDKTWQVEFVALIVGRDQVSYEASEVRAAGGIFKGGNILNALDDANALETGAVVAPVRLQMKIVAEVV